MNNLTILLVPIFFLGFRGICSGEMPGGKAPPTHQTEEITWIAGKLPATSKTEGEWLWDGKMRQDQVPSHTDGIRGAVSSHSFIAREPIRINADSRIIQHVLLDPAESPSGIMMRLFLDGQEQMSVYWEGEEEAFAGIGEYITAWYMGPLPKKGRWASLEIDFKEMDITETQLKGICFMTSGGRAWWGKTVVIK